MPSFEASALSLLTETNRIEEERLNRIRSEFAVDLSNDSDIDERVLAQILSSGAISCEDFMLMLSEDSGLELIDLENRVVGPDALALIDGRTAQEHKTLPISYDGEVLVLAVSDPWHCDLGDRLADELNCYVDYRLASPALIISQLDRYYGPEEEGSGSAGQDETRPKVLDNPPGLVGRPHGTDNGKTPVADFVRLILEDAIGRNASDIHIEPMRRLVRIRYRIDGRLEETHHDLPSRLQSSFVARIKVMARMNMAEKRLPQDGRIRQEFYGKTVDFRVSTVPSVHGESLVMRILNAEEIIFGVSQLGLLEQDQRRFERLISTPHGMMLITGPTGSGKTTTLYAAMQYLNQKDRKIITVEDPVEYQIAGINQVPINPAVGMEFSTALRAVLRQSPNIIMIGEIRDAETADIAINASLTGHMVFSTLHTNDAPSAVTRLIDIGVEPFLIAAGLRSVMAQRLVRLLCRDCRKSYRLSSHQRVAFGFDKDGEDEEQTFWEKSGCPQCRGSGFRGRCGLFEIFEIDEKIRPLIHEKSSLSDLRKLAFERGHTLLVDGMKKARSGMTTLNELLAVTMQPTE